MECPYLLVLRVQLLPHSPVLLLRVLDPLVHYQYRLFQNLVIASQIDARLAQDALLLTQVSAVVLVAHLLHVTLKQTKCLIDVLGFRVQSSKDPLRSIVYEECSFGRKMILGLLLCVVGVASRTELNFSRKFRGFV